MTLDQITVLIDNLDKTIISYLEAVRFPNKLKYYLQAIQIIQKINQLTNAPKGAELTWDASLKIKRDFFLQWQERQKLKDEIAEKKGVRRRSKADHRSDLPMEQRGEFIRLPMKLIPKHYKPDPQGDEST